MLRRRLAYLGAFLVALVTFLGTNEPLAFGVVVLLVVLFAAGAVSCVALAATIELEAEAPASCEAGQPFLLTMVVRRMVHLPVGRIECTVRCRNVMTGDEQAIPVVLGASYAPVARFELPLDTSMCGRIELTVNEVRLCDSLGLLRRAVSSVQTLSFTVYPRVLELSVPLERSPRAAFSGVAYDPRRRGQDMSEPFDLRDYRPTDPPHAIHWKLSTKLDKLLVREASHPSNYDILVLVDAGLHRPDGTAMPLEAIRAILELAVSVSYGLCRQNVGHNVAFTDDGQLRDAMVDSLASFDEMLDVLVGTPLQDVSGVDAGAFEWYRREHSFTKTVLVTGCVDEHALVEWGAVFDLSVLVVSEEGATAVAQAGSFTLTSFSVDDVNSRVKSVVI